MREQQDGSQKSDAGQRQINASDNTAESVSEFNPIGYDAPRHSPPGTLTRKDVLRLQQTHGNAYVRRMLAQRQPGRVQREANQAAIQSIIMWVEDVPGMPNNFPGAYEKLNSLSQGDMRDTLVSLRSQGYLDTLLNHFNEARGVNISHLMAGFLLAILTGVDPAHPSEETLGRLAKALQVARTGLSARVMALPAGWRNRIVNAVPTVAAGSVHDTRGEDVGGVHYVVQNSYDWQLEPTQMRIVVKFKFTGVINPTVVGQWFSRIRSDWNVFKAVNTTDRAQSVNIEFDPQIVGSNPHHTVQIKSGAGRDNEGEWYLGATPGDSESLRMATHEFGHTVGLKDEYQLTHGDYVATVGSEPDAGAAAAAPGSPSADVIARKLYAALHIGTFQLFSGTERADKADAIIAQYGLTQGTFAQSVATAYNNDFHVGIVADIVDQIPSARQFPIVDPFTYSSTSVMGQQTDHDHPVLARHVRDFVTLVQTAKGGTWEAQPR